MNFLRSIFSSARSQSPTRVMAAKSKAEELINNNPVVVFSKSYCPFCKQTKQLLSELGAKYELLELDQIDDGSAIQAALKDITNQNTVPNVFIDHKHIGGNSELQAKKKELPALLKQAGAL